MCMSMKPEMASVNSTLLVPPSLAPVMRSTAYLTLSSSSCFRRRQPCASKTSNMPFGSMLTFRLCLAAYSSTMRSARAEIVASGPTPREVGISAPSTTSRPSWVSEPRPVKTSPRWLVAPVSPVPSRAICAPLPDSNHQRQEQSSSSLLPRHLPDRVNSEFSAPGEEVSHQYYSCCLRGFGFFSVLFFFSFVSSCCLF